jgi:hypothetical protein
MTPETFAKAKESVSLGRQIGVDPNFVNDYLDDIKHVMVPDPTDLDMDKILDIKATPEELATEYGKLSFSEKTAQRAVMLFSKTIEKSGTFGIIPRMGQISDEPTQYRYEGISPKIDKAVDLTADIGAFSMDFYIAGKLLKMVKLPGGQYLTDHLSKVGKAFTSRWLPEGIKSSKPLAVASYNALVRSIETAPETASTLFMVGASEAKKDESKPLSGLEMAAMYTPFAVVLAPAEPFISAGAGFLKRSVAAAVTKTMTKLETMKKSPVPFEVPSVNLKEDIVESAKTLYKTETGSEIPNAALANLEQQADDIATKTKNIIDAEKSAAEGRMAYEADVAAGKTSAASDAESGMNSYLKEQYIAETKVAGQVGAEALIAPTIRNSIKLADDFIDANSTVISDKTRFKVIRQPDRNYAILDENFHEVAVDIKRKDIADKINDVIYGVNEKLPTTSLSKNRTKLTVVEEVELKRAIKRMASVSNDAYRAGVSSANEKAVVKLSEARERFNTFRQTKNDEILRTEIAKDMVKKHVPKEEQSKFLTRIVRSRKEGNLESIADDIERYLYLDESKVAVGSIRETYANTVKSYKARVGNNIDRFAKAPDNIRPTLESIYKDLNPDDVYLPKTVDDIPLLHDTVSKYAGNVKNAANDFNSAIGGDEEAKALMGLSDSVIDNLSTIAGKAKGTIDAGDIQFVDDIAKFIIRQKELENTLIIAGQEQRASEFIKTISGEVKTKPLKIEKLGAKKRSIGDLWGVESDNIDTLAYKMFGSKSRIHELLNDWRAGEIKAMGIKRDGFEIFRNYATANGVTDKTIKGLSKEVTVKIGGEDIAISRDELLSQVMFIRDPDNYNQLMKSAGLRIRNIPNNKITNDELTALIDELSPEEKILGQSFFYINNLLLAPKTNEISVVLNGKKMAVDPLYYPRHRKMTIKVTGNKFNVSSATVENNSRFLPRTGGTSEIKMTPFTKELIDTMQAVANYNGMAIPMRNLKTVLADKTLQKTLIENGHEKELTNFIKILSRSEGFATDSSVADMIGSSALRTYTTGALGLRTSSFFSAASSFPAAKAKIPMGYFRPQDLIYSGDTIKMLEANSDYLWDRWVGRGVGIELGSAASQGSIERHLMGKTPLDEMSTFLMVQGDKLSVLPVFRAARRMIAKEQELAGQELEKAAISMTEDVIRSTQGTYSMLDRSVLSSDPSLFKRSITMFRSQQDKQLNLLKQANITYSESAKTSGDKVKLARSYEAIAESTIAYAVAKNVYRAARITGIGAAAHYIFGKYLPGDEKEFIPTTTKDIIKSSADTFPLGGTIIEVIDYGVQKAMGEMKFQPQTKDPFSSMAEGVSEVSGIAGKWINKAVENTGTGENRYGINKEWTEFYDNKEDSGIGKEIIKDILKSARNISLFTPVPLAAPIDEWVYPILKESKHKEVNAVVWGASDDAVKMQGNLDKFLTRWNELSSKETKGGLDKPEQDEVLAMQGVKSYIDSMFRVYDKLPDDAKEDGILQGVEDSLKEYYK